MRNLLHRSLAPSAFSQGEAAKIHTEKARAQAPPLAAARLRPMPRPPHKNRHAAQIGPSATQGASADQP